MSSTESAAKKQHTYTVTVSWKGGTDFRYSRDPLKVAVGTDIITFQRKPGESWKFLGIAIYGPSGPQPSCDDACYSRVVAAPFQVTSLADDHIQLTDTDAGATKQTFHYRLGVNENPGKTWCSDPEIINKAD